MKEGENVTKKPQKYVMTSKMKDGSATPSGGVVKTDSKGKPIKRDDTKKKGKGGY
jgi:hypothetical protein